MTYTLMDVPYWSMLPNLTSDKKEREQISVIPRIFAALAGLAISSLGLKIVSVLGKGNQKSGFLLFAIIVSVIFIVTISITVKSQAELNLVKVYNAMLKKALEGDVNSANWLVKFSDSKFFKGKKSVIDELVGRFDMSE